MDQQRSVDAALVPLVASLAPWGVEEAHWLPDRDGVPVVWVRVRTALQRVSLQAQPWVLAQVQVTLSRLGVAPHVVLAARVEVTSAEDEAQLFDE